jgi:hypothetical protein
MPCNKKTCPDYKPRGRTSPGYGRGVTMSRETFPKRDTSQINVPTWDRDCVMYPYEDVCEVIIETYEGGETTTTTTTDPETGEETTTSETSDQYNFANLDKTGPNSGKLYEELDLTSTSWWERFNICPPFTLSGGNLGSSTTSDPRRVRYWDHYPSELSFEPNYSDSPFLYLWDTKEHATGRPCYVICWVLTRVADPGESGSYVYTYTPRKTPFECDATPDETYVEYYTQDGKLTPPGDPNENPLIWAVGTKTEGVVFRYVSGLSQYFTSVYFRLIGNITKEDYKGIGPKTLMATRQEGPLNTEVYTEIGANTAIRLLSSDSASNRWTTNVVVKNSSNQTVATLNITARPAAGKGDTEGRPDAVVKLNSISQGDVLPVPGVQYDLNVPIQGNASETVYLGKVIFKDIVDLSAGLSGNRVISQFASYVGTASDVDLSNPDNFIPAIIGEDSGIVNGIGGSVWAPGNSGINNIQKVFNLDGSSAAYGPTTGSGLRVEIRASKYTDADGGSDTEISIIRVISYGDGKYQEGSVFPITFTTDNGTYTCGYLKILTTINGALTRGVPTGIRLAEPKMVGGVYAVSHSTWNSWGNSYAIWSNNSENNLSGRPLEIVHKQITLPAGSYSAEYGFDDEGTILIWREDTGSTVFESATIVGGVYNGSSFSTGSFTLSEETIVNITVNMENNPGGSWTNNPSGWAVVLKRGGTIQWTTRDATNGINVGDAYKGMRFENTPYVNAWGGGGGTTPFLSLQGACWSARDATVYKDYSIPGGLKVRMKIESRWNEDTDTFNTVWRIEEIVRYGSGYGSVDASDFSEGGEVFADQEVYYLYYPSADTPKENRIGIALVISDTQDIFTIENVADQFIEPGETVNGWTIDAVNRFDDGFNAGYLKLIGGGNEFQKDATYTTSGGESIRILAGYGIKDRGALFGKYEFAKKQIQYATARVSEGVPFEPQLIRPQATGVIRNGRLVGFQITRPGKGLSNRNIEPIKLSVDPPPTEFDHARFNQLVQNKDNDILRTIEKCTGTGKPAFVEPILSGGRLVSIRILDPGRGYSESNPPQIRVPYIAKINKQVVQEQSTTEESEPEVQDLYNKSPAFNNTFIQQSYGLQSYNADSQINYDEQFVNLYIPDIVEVNLDDTNKEVYLLPENTLDANWINQFETEGKTEYTFTEDVQITHDALIEGSRQTGAGISALTDFTGSSQNSTIKTNQYLNSEVSADSLKIARSGKVNTDIGIERTSYSLNVSDLPGEVQSSTTRSISDIDREDTNLASQYNPSYIGPSGSLDHYSTQFRDFLTQDIQIPPTSEPNRGSGTLNVGDAQQITGEINSAVTGVISNQSGNEQGRTVSRNFDTKILDDINTSYREARIASLQPRTIEERTQSFPSTAILTVTGGFYKLPCATSTTKYLIQTFCPDPRESTFLNVRLGVKINPNPTNPDIGRCKQCLLDNSSLQPILNNIDDEDAVIEDAFCVQSWPLSSIHSSSLGFISPFYLGALGTRYDRSSDLYEGIRSWEISGNLHILHDLTQETKTFVSALSKYGNPYDYYCNRNYGDLGEEDIYQTDDASQEEDDEVPDQLADTNPANV